VVPDARYWAALVIFAAAGLGVRVAHGGPLLRRQASALSRLDLAPAFVAVLALGFHCAAMFFPSVVAEIPGAVGGAGAVRALGTASQLAYWLPAGVLLLALRRTWTPLLVAEAGVLLAVGVTMFWDFGLPVHLSAIAGSVAVTVTVLTTVVVRSGPRPAGA